jgi:RNase P/RNase MRP subunit p29
MFDEDRQTLVIDSGSGMCRVLIDFALFLISLQKLNKQ